MTAITALLSNKGIAVASDSLITVPNSLGRYTQIEVRKPKIIPVRNIHACISYWGFAGIPDGNQQLRWSFYNWLKRDFSHSRFPNLEDFSNDLRDKIENLFRQLNVRQNHRGIGLHITGVETVRNIRIPELFLVSNYVDTAYTQLGNLICSRRSYHHVSSENDRYDVANHSHEDYRLRVHEHLKRGYLLFNNGDPEMFNPLSMVVFGGIRIAKSRGNLKQFNTIQDEVPIVKRPLEIIKRLQTDFWKPDKQLIGGKIHDLTISNYGQFHSFSSRKTFGL